MSSNEFVHSTPRDFGKNSIICLACHKGNTPETIAAAKLGKEMGAAVIILTWLEESEIIEFGDYIIHYSFDASPDHLAGDIDYAGEKTMCALQVAVELLNQTEGYSNYDKFQQGAGMITTVIRKARAHVAQRALDFAEEYKNDSVIYTMGSGAGYGAAYMESICIFMEMQWIHSEPIHTGEFFHGPFEVTDTDVPFIVLKNYGKDCDENVKKNWITEYGADYKRPLVEIDSAVGAYSDSMNGETRVLDVRAEAFIKRFSEHVIPIDCNEFDMEGIDEDLRNYFAVLVAGVVLRAYADEIAYYRGHPLSVRRYMWCMEY